MASFFKNLKKLFAPQGEAAPREIPAFPEYSLVRVKKILHPEADHDGWEINERPPRGGDIGTVTDVLHDPKLPLLYVVECSGIDGKTIWLTEFVAEELEAV